MICGFHLLKFQPSLYRVSKSRVDKNWISFEFLVKIDDWKIVLYALEDFKFWIKSRYLFLVLMFSLWHVIFTQSLGVHYRLELKETPWDFPKLDWSPLESHILPSFMFSSLNTLWHHLQWDWKSFLYSQFCRVRLYIGFMVLRSGFIQ